MLLLLRSFDEAGGGDFCILEAKLDEYGKGIREAVEPDESELSREEELFALRP